MGLYNFKKQFVPFIKSGEKKHTIRVIRKNPDKPGNTLYLYTGLRTKKAKLLKRVECVKVEEIVISCSPAILPGETDQFFVAIDGTGLGADEREQLARRDGFSNFSEMMKFWTTPKNRLPFTGHIIHWK